MQLPTVLLPPRALLFFISGGDALLPQPFRGFGHIAIGFFQLQSIMPAPVFFAQLLTTCADIPAILPQFLLDCTTKSHCLLNPKYFYFTQDSALE